MNNVCHLYQKNITLQQALLGGNFKIRTISGQTIRVKLKPGSFSGKVIRIKAALDSASASESTDTYIQLKVMDHPVYSIDNLDLRASLLLTPAEAMAGCVKKLSSPEGRTVNVIVKPKSSDGDEIIIKNAGLANEEGRGDIIFKIKIDFLDYVSETDILENMSGRDKLLH